MNYLLAIEAELRRAGVQTWDVIQSKHLKVRFTWNGRTHTFVTPRSPSARPSSARRQSNGCPCCQA